MEFIRVSGINRNQVKNFDWQPGAACSDLESGHSEGRSNDAGVAGNKMGQSRAEICPAESERTAQLNQAMRNLAIQPVVTL